MFDAQTDPLSAHASFPITHPKDRTLRRQDFLPLTNISTLNAALLGAHDKIFSNSPLSREPEFKYKIDSSISFLKTGLESLMENTKILPRLDSHCVEGLQRSIETLSPSRLSIDALMDIEERIVWQTHMLRRRFLADLFFHESEVIKQSPKDAYMRWMIRRDYPETMEIEYESYGDPWELSNVAQWIRDSTHIGMVLTLNEPSDMVGGASFHEVHRDYIRVPKIIVDPALRRRGMGTIMLEKLKSKLTAHRHPRLVMEVHEDNLPALCWLRANDFRAMKVLRCAAPDGCDVYRMEYSLPESKK